MRGQQSVKKEMRLMKKEVREIYKREKSALRLRCEKEIKAFAELIGFQDPEEPPHRSTAVEVGNAVSHGIGAALSIVILVIMMSHSQTLSQRVGGLVYFFGLFILFLSSCLYHAMPYGWAAKRLFRRFDYASVYLLIGATFCPIILNISTSSNTTAVLLIQWTVIILGATAALVFGTSKYALHIALYLVLGWSALLLLPSISRTNADFFYTILVGGLFYTVGVIPCAVERRAAHFIWHLFVLAGAAVQCWGVLNYIYLR